MNGPTITVLSLGAGVQSTTLALLAVEGALPKPNAAIFADTGWEPAAVYAHLDRLEAVMAAAGIPVHRVSRGSLRDDVLRTGRVQIPLFLKDGDGERGINGRACTRDYKVMPIRAKVRELLGHPSPRPVPPNVWAEQWIGFSTDEIGRVNASEVRFIRHAHPLLDLSMSRAECVRWLAARGWGSTPKSACIGCPFHGNAAWRRLRDENPSEWADAVAFDREIRQSPHRLRGEPYLHRSLLPLADAPIDHVTRSEWNDRQGDLFDVIAENGDPDGCSPYGCRSGAAVGAS